MKIQNAHVAITGAASGIGAALARRFAREGARALALADIDAERVQEVAGALGAAAQADAVDVRSEAQIREWLARARERSGPIDLLCSNAGVIAVGDVQAPDEDWQRLWEVHVMAHVWGARAVLPQMVERGRGYLLQTASAAGLLAQVGSSPYSVTKHAAVALAESISIEYGDRGIGVSVLCPQAVRTGMTAGTERGGVAGVDGMLEPDAVADCVVQGLDEERFLILPHPAVQQYAQRRTGDPDRWLRGMRRLRASYRDGGLGGSSSPGSARPRR